jgi:FkbM family methyltransferase
MPEFLSDKLKDLNYEPRIAIDVGANRGGWTRRLLSLFPSVKVLLIEASDKHRQRLVRIKKEEQIDFRIAVLSERSHLEVQFFESGDTGNSLFKEASEHYAAAQPTSRETITLDDLVATSFLVDQTVDLLKLDVQGAELVVLKGATKVLQQASFVLLETSLVEFNRGGACYWEIDYYLRSLGYRMYEMGDFNYNPELFKTPGLGQYDVLYVNSKNRPEALRNVDFCHGSNSLRSGLISRDAETRLVWSPPQGQNYNWLMSLAWFVGGYLLCSLQNRVARTRHLRPKS